MRFLEVVIALANKEFEQRRPKLTSRIRGKINSRTYMYLFMKASRRSTNMFRFWTFCHERDSGQAGYPTLMRLHGKLSPQLTGLPHLADRATRLGGSPHLSCKRDQNEIRNYMDRWVTPPRRVTSPTWGPPPPCKHALSVVILMEMRFNLWLPLLLWSVQWSWLR